MRRSTAISQVLLLLAFYLVPLAASSSVLTPACCRQHGAHHCTMRGASPGSQTTLTAAGQCPYRFPAIVLTHTTKLFLAPASVSTAPSNSEPLLDEDSGQVSRQIAAILDSRGPPPLTF
ncbi:MAG TPA: hypothetical protein VFU86_21570 [Terriglobales bacterium]|nr:hypothetical protein [Terriglobales bacterium]